MLRRERAQLLLPALALARLDHRARAQEAALQVGGGLAQELKGAGGGGVHSLEDRVGWLEGAGCRGRGRRRALKAPPCAAPWSSSRRPGA